MAAWPENPRLISTNIPRIDGLLKASGRAKYPSDQRPEGTLFGVMLYSPHAHARIKSVDVSDAKKLPGVKAIVIIGATDEGDKETFGGKGRVVRYHGDDIAAVAATTEEQARDAVRAIKVDYEILPHVATEEQAIAPNAPKVVGRGNTQKGQEQVKGNPQDAVKESDAVVEAVYSAPTITHVCLETHGLTAAWVKPDTIMAWASTQAVQPTAQELAGRFNIPVTNVTVLTEVMGGGFGSKFGADLWGVTAAELSQKAGGAPVKMFLDRVQEHLAAGNRPSCHAKLTIAGKKDGTVTALIARALPALMKTSVWARRTLRML